MCSLSKFACNLSCWGATKLRDIWYETLIRFFIITVSARPEPRQKIVPLRFLFIKWEIFGQRWGSRAHSIHDADQKDQSSGNLRWGPILAVLIHSLLRAPSKILFVSPCPPECYLQSETKIEPDLRLSSGNDAQTITYSHSQNIPFFVTCLSDQADILTVYIEAERILIYF